jgi:hypothetical protein
MTAKIIPFYRPGIDPRPVPPSENTETPPSTDDKAEFNAQAEEEFTARAVLEEVLEHSDTLTDILIMIRDMDGQIGFVTNVDGFTESLAFIERVKHGMLNHDTNMT